MIRQPKKIFRALMLASVMGSFAGALPARAAEKDPAATAAAAASFTPAQQAEIKALMKDYLIHNPEVVIEALTVYQKNQDKEEAKAFDKNLAKYKDYLVSADTPFAGNPKGKTAIVEFFDYNCGYCKHAVDDVNGLVKADPDIKVYFKDIPILSATSSDAARWALAANKQGKYWEFHQALMHSSLPRNKDTFKKIGGDVGLDVAKLEKDADGDKDIRDAIEKNLAASRDLGVHGTPAFIIHDQLFPGYMGLKNMQKVVAGETPKPEDAQN